MIKNLTEQYGRNKGIQVVVQNFCPYISNSNYGKTFNQYDISQPIGSVRYNPTTSTLEVFDGIYWVVFGKDVTIGLDDRIANILLWAESKMNEEEELEQLCSKFPALEKAYQNLETIKKLVKDST